MNKNRNNRKIYIFILMALIFFITIGYASINTMLKINSITTLGANKWLVGFQNLSQPELVGDAQEINPPILTSTSINLDVLLLYPGDSITYYFDVVNNGTIDAKLSNTPIITGISSDLEDKLIFQLTYNDGTSVNTNDTLDSGESKKMKLTVKYIQDDSFEFNETSKNIYLTILYEQK